VIGYTALELLAFLRTYEVEREWKMAALAAQLPSRSRPSLREPLVRGLLWVANQLDPVERVPSVAH
jgi:hypothetical protein